MSSSVARNSTGGFVVGAVEGGVGTRRVMPYPAVSCEVSGVGGIRSTGGTSGLEPLLDVVATIDRDGSADTGCGSWWGPADISAAIIAAANSASGGDGGGGDADPAHGVGKASMGAGTLTGGADSLTGADGAADEEAGDDCWGADIGTGIPT